MVYVCCMCLCKVSTIERYTIFSSVANTPAHQKLFLWQIISISIVVALTFSHILFVSRARTQYSTHTRALIQMAKKEALEYY